MADTFSEETITDKIKEFLLEKGYKVFDPTAPDRATPDIIISTTDKTFAFNVGPSVSDPGLSITVENVTINMGGN